MEKWLQGLQLPWLDRVQSRVVLPTARTLYLLVAGLCVAIAGLGLLIAFTFQMAAWQLPRQNAVPDEVAPTPAAVNLRLVEQRLSPPSNLRFVVDASPLPSAVSTDTVLGHFEADTPNGLAAYPEAFQVIGGRDADYFTPGSDGRARTVLRGQPALVSLLASPEFGAAGRQFQVRVVAKDRYGNRTTPVNLDFTLSFGAAAPSPASGDQDATPASLLEIARRLAHVADPTHATPAYYEARREALGEPARCNAFGNETFTVLYGQAVAQAMPRLRPDNLGAFYLGVCDAWRDAVNRGLQEAQAANFNRAQIIARNFEAKLEAAAKRASSRAFRNLALTVVGGAIFAFMVVALFLAFLAIEGHSSAVRQALVALAANQAREDERPNRPLQSDVT
jgi:hypothetical protein